MNDRFSLWDYWALFKLSLRNFFWSIEGSKNSHFLIKLLCVLYALDAVYNLLRLPLLMVACILYFKIFELFVCLSLTALRIAVVFLVGFNADRLRYAIQFKNSAYYKNTGIRPSEIVQDKGLYGEYIGTMAAEKCLETNGVRGRVFNNVLIPQHGGNFAEADIVSISAMGIHVIEAKARIGTFSGNYGDENWQQQAGAQVYTIKNPLWQNLWHCNYLSEYLHANLPDCDLKRKNIAYKIKNCALFVSSSISGNLSDYIMPNINFFCGMAETNYAKARFDPHVLSAEEVDLLCKIIEPIASYSRFEYAKKMQERELRRQRGGIQLSDGVSRHKWSLRFGRWHASA